ncbi:hypothetical protein [Paenibacillus harenae]|uniref:DUF1292 domain-containing protein n=1 Tax=Paenibacillus harenae TaxID=306543 RepID=A0ABT9U1H8_PAEHA|nr:hypothetical protein [Paenibacillus harenae]MDQ0113490.1 hypothetical protein [Paenibacillus harenae]
MVKKEDLEDREHNDLVTERDIDPAFGLFADEEQTEEVMDATDELLRKYPDSEAGLLGAVIANEGDDEVDTPEEISAEIAAVPDADVIAMNSPVDPAAPEDEFHGTDLLNGVGRHPEEETEEQ